MEEKSSAMHLHGITLLELLRRPEISYKDLKRFSGMPAYLPEVEEQIEIQVRYQGYIEKQEAQVRQFNQLEKKLLPQDVNYEELKGLSLEAREKLNRLKPHSLGQASRITGVTPADINVLLLFLEHRKGLKGGEPE
ncbi:tRNA uridine 5-carboxymethylaminomethyl modification enzyme MnmG [bioreactor metagenome]|uniref:tRNA uridine 5-carboxymethylaminomethyl modification enzyme MnmG n=1 Tax=bioreactor metagenome TaxID=1076179 RepID=A0A645ITS5_9ZZZZ